MSDNNYKQYKHQFSFLVTRLAKMLLSVTRGPKVSAFFIFFLCDGENVVRKHVTTVGRPGCDGCVGICARVHKHYRGYTEVYILN